MESPIWVVEYGGEEMEAHNNMCWGEMSKASGSQAPDPGGDTYQWGAAFVKLVRPTRDDNVQHHGLGNRPDRATKC